MLKRFKLAILLATLGIVFVDSWPPFSSRSSSRRRAGPTIGSSSGRSFSLPFGSEFPNIPASPFGSAFPNIPASPFGSAFPNFPASPFNSGSGYQKKTSGYNVIKSFQNDDNISMDELIESVKSMLKNNFENEFGNNSRISTRKIRLCCDDNEELTNCIELNEGEICDRKLVERESSIFATTPNAVKFSWTEKIEGGRREPTESFFSTFPESTQNYNEPQQLSNFGDPRSFSSSPSYDYSEIRKPEVSTPRQSLGLSGRTWNSRPQSTGLFFRNNVSTQLPTDDPLIPAVPYYNNNKRPDNSNQQPSFQTLDDIRKPKGDQNTRFPRNLSYENVLQEKPETKPETHTPYPKQPYSWSIQQEEDQKSSRRYGNPLNNTPKTKPEPYSQSVSPWSKPQEEDQRLSQRYEKPLNNTPANKPAPISEPVYPWSKQREADQKSSPWYGKPLNNTPKTKPEPYSQSVSPWSKQQEEDQRLSQRYEKPLNNTPANKPAPISEPVYPWSKQREGDQESIKKEIEKPLNNTPVTYPTPNPQPVKSWSTQPEKNQRSPQRYGNQSQNTPVTEPTPDLPILYQWGTKPHEQTTDITKIPYKTDDGKRIVITSLKESTPINLEEFRKQALERHNDYRTKLGVPKLVMDYGLNQSAQAYATLLAEKNKVGKQMQHTSNDDCKKGNFGENLAYYSRRSNDLGYRCADDWWSEIRFCKPTDDEYILKSLVCNETIGHATQLLWGESTRIGCGFGRNVVGAYYVVCHYSPRGNKGSRDDFINNVPFPFKQNDIDDARRLAKHLFDNWHEELHLFGEKEDLNSEEKSPNNENSDIEKLLGLLRLKENK